MELFWRGFTGGIGGWGRRVGWRAVRTPVPLVRTGIRIKHDDATVAGVGDEDFVRLGVYLNGRRALQSRAAVRCAELARFANLQQELTVARELQHVRIFRGRRRRSGRTACAASTATTSSGRRRQTCSRQPDVAVAIDRNAAWVQGPVIAGAWTAPVTDKRARRVELQDEWRGGTAMLGPRCGQVQRRFRTWVERSLAAMQDPHVITAIHRDARDRSEYPVIGQWTGPKRINFRFRRRLGESLQTAPPQKNECARREARGECMP